ncbi:formate dehydrogenase subunit alpha [Novispirillum sp. DQ9]|uniref:formate dehydrogenase subunit alpha n=1 Tax=Novispirillum sp. DQ9 TaxID=3398612 RepID=UPI003C79DC6C
MTAPVTFSLDGRTVTAAPGETIWQVADRHGLTLPHLCHKPAPGYRPDGNCRACLVEVAGERTLAASCRRPVAEGMVVRTASERATKARRLVLELLAADQPTESAPDSAVSRWAEALDVRASRFPARAEPPPAEDRSHPAMTVRLDACIHCGLCERACREVQANDVIGLAFRGAGTQVVFDLADPMGASSCVGCGECVQACPTGALLPRSADAGQASERTVDSVCPYCGVGCQLTYHVAGERLLKVEGRDGEANQNRLCVKGRFGFDYIHHPHRLTRPLIRKDGAPKELIDPATPLTHFREATWEEALDRAAQGLAAIRDSLGGAALAGFGSAKGSNEEAYLFQKLVRTGFSSNNVDHCTRLCHASSVAALMETIGSGATTAPVREVENADCIVVIGANPTVNHPVAATYIKAAAKRGARLIVLDPRGGHGLARHATDMLRFRPGADVTLLNALMHVIVTEGLHDTAYLDAFTEGFDAFRGHLQAYAPEAVAEVCGIPADTLRSVARAIATARGCMIFWGMGVSQHVHGTDNVRCLISLALLCGHMGKPGAGLHPLRGQNNVQGASDAGLIPMVFPDYRKVGDAAARGHLEALWGAPLLGVPGLTVVEIMGAAEAGRIKGMLIMGENPAMSDPDLEHARKALATLEHLVVQDLFLTETACFADVVLPASAFPEKSGTFTNTDRKVQLGRAALAPPGDVRQDLWILQELARRLGLDWDYAGPAEVFAEMRRAMPSHAGITWDRLERDGAVTYPCPEEGAPGQPILFADGFPTENGRGKLVPAHAVPPDERPDADFPMILTTGRVLEHWHTGSMTRRSAALDALEPEACCHVAPEVLERLGVPPGQPVRLTTRRGSITLTARAEPGLPDDLVFMPFCYTEAAANLLTNAALDPYGKIPELKFCAVKVEGAV